MKKTLSLLLLILLVSCNGHFMWVPDAQFCTAKKSEMEMNIGRGGDWCCEEYGECCWLSLTHCDAKIAGA